MHSEHQLSSSENQGHQVDRISPNMDDDTTTASGHSFQFSLITGDYAWCRNLVGRVDSSTSWTSMPKISYTYSDTSRCYVTHNPRARMELQESYEQVTEFSFTDNSGTLSFELYVRRSDYHAKALCISPRAYGDDKVCCVCLSSVGINRHGTFIGYTRQCRLPCDTRSCGLLFSSTISRQCQFSTVPVESSGA